MKKGFTLVELSIVLVIIGLIVGGVVGGQSLVRSSRLNAVHADIQKFKTAINTFDLQYDAVPGDMTDAWDYWGTDCDDDEDTCNGDGDYKLEPLDAENIMFWNHLYLSNILSGTVGSAPMTPLNDSSKYLASYDQLFYISGRGAGVKTNYILIAKIAGYRGYVFTPAEAYLLDKKNDDGLPGIGQIKAFRGDEPRCTTSRDIETARYNLDNDSISCTMHFLWD
jgi:prepilin-type N-terminal cleavage/methylation domain-containing protein